MHPRKAVARLRCLLRQLRGCDARAGCCDSECRFARRCGMQAVARACGSSRTRRCAPGSACGSSPANGLSDTTSRNARSVVSSSRCATGRRSASYESSSAGIRLALRRRARASTRGCTHPAGRCSCLARRRGCARARRRRAGSSGDRESARRRDDECDRSRTSEHALIDRLAPAWPLHRGHHGGEIQPCCSRSCGRHDADDAPVILAAHREEQVKALAPAGRRSPRRPPCCRSPRRRRRRTRARRARPENRCRSARARRCARRRSRRPRPRSTLRVVAVGLPAASRRRAIACCSSASSSVFHCTSTPNSRSFSPMMRSLSS